MAVSTIALASTFTLVSSLSFTTQSLNSISAIVSSLSVTNIKYRLNFLGSNGSLCPLRLMITLTFSCNSFISKCHPFL